MTKDQEERLVASWEAIAKGLGEFNEVVRTAIRNQWPETRPTREAIITRIPTPEERLRQETGNTVGPVSEWLGEFDPEEEIGPREKEFLAARAKRSSGSEKNK